MYKVLHAIKGSRRTSREPLQPAFDMHAVASQFIDTLASDK